MKLEEVIIQGELKFSEIEWINVSETGTCLVITGNGCRIENSQVYQEGDTGVALHTFVV